jgi:hypothetical protein
MSQRSSRLLATHNQPIRPERPMAIHLAYAHPDRHRPPQWPILPSRLCYLMTANFRCVGVARRPRRISGWEGVPQTLAWPVRCAPVTGRGPARMSLVEKPRNKCDLSTTLRKWRPTAAPRPSRLCAPHKSRDSCDALSPKRKQARRRRKHECDRVSAESRGSQFAERSASDATATAFIDTKRGDVYES